MSFRINTNVSSMNAQQIGVGTNRNLSNSLEKLSSGLRINKAADDASGMAIADSLRSQANTLGQAIANANDGIGIVQVADKAMDEQVKILDTIKTKATQAAQDGQSLESRKAIQSDINRLLEELDNIASTTSFNGIKLLSGSYSNKEFQIGAYSNETIKVSIGATSSDKIGSVRVETGSLIENDSEVTLKFKKANSNDQDVVLETVTVSTSAGTGIGVLAQTINKNSDMTGIRATYIVESTSEEAIKAGEIKGLKINGVLIGDIEVSNVDNDGKLVNSINALTDKTGVTASMDVTGKLHLKSNDGRGMKIENESASIVKSKEVVQEGDIKNLKVNGVSIGTITGVAQNDADGKLINAINAKSSQTGVTASIEDGRLVIEGNKDSEGRYLEPNKVIIVSADNGPMKANQSFNSITANDENYGRLSLVKNNARDIAIEGKGAGFSASVAETTTNLRSVLGTFDANVASSIGANANEINAENNSNGIGAGVTSLKGAMLVMDIAETAVRELDKIRANLGSVQQQLVATVNNISVTQVNVKAAESQIRDVDFAKESSNFSKNNILSQSGSYALSQANVTQQNVLRLLQ